ncbi:MAG: DUF448 domain-containing protein [Eubacterium sp.]|nr:DUF448 domain-containing protein [Eubacterium sp.]
MSTKKKNRGRVPIRKCVICDSEKSKSEMMRIIVSGRNTEVEEAALDETGRKRGRGAYICRNGTCISKAYEDGIIDSETRDACIADMNNYKISLLSIAMKAGKVASGEFQSEEAVLSGKAGFVIIAEDASDNTKKKFMDKCNYRGIRYEIFGKKDELGRLIGKNERSVVAITDDDFSTQFLKRFGGNE